MRYAEKLKVLRAGPDQELLWSMTDDFPALIWGANEEEGDQPGWWLYWTDMHGGAQRKLISGDTHDEAGAKVRALEALAIARPGT